MYTIPPQFIWNGNKKPYNFTKVGLTLLSLTHESFLMVDSMIALSFAGELQSLMDSHRFPPQRAPQIWLSIAKRNSEKEKNFSLKCTLNLLFVRISLYYMYDVYYVLYYNVLLHCILYIMISKYNIQ